MAQVTDDWAKVERRFAELNELKMWQPTVAAMRRLVTAIRADSRFHDLDPSLSHTALVFRRDAKRAVFACWNDDGTYGVAFVEHPFELKDGRRIGEDCVLDVLLEYLERAPP